jgi:hypothetical protein
MRRAAAEQVVSSGSGDTAQPPADTVAAGAGTAAMTCGASAASDPNMILSLPGAQSVKHRLRVMPVPCNDIWVCRLGLNESLPTARAGHGLTIALRKVTLLWLRGNERGVPCCLRGGHGSTVEHGAATELGAAWPRDRPSTQRIPRAATRGILLCWPVWVGRSGLAGLGWPVWVGRSGLGQSGLSWSGRLDQQSRSYRPALVSDRKSANAARLIT